MITVVFSDLHGNLPAIIKLKSLYPKSTKWLSLGDNVNYGPWSNECVQFIEQEMDCICLLGNHEEYFLSGAYDGKNEVARTFFNFCYERFSQQSIISKYIDKIDIGSYHCSHTINNKYIFHDTDIVINKNHLIGHSHQQYSVTKGTFNLVNPGSLGQNRKYINQANYALYCHDTDKLDLKTFTFDLNLVISEMKLKKYPQICLDYYQNKEQIT